MKQTIHDKTFDARLCPVDYPNNASYHLIFEEWHRLRFWICKGITVMKCQWAGPRRRVYTSEPWDFCNGLAEGEDFGPLLDLLRELFPGSDQLMEAYRKCP